MRLFRDSIAEIQADRALRWFGIALATHHVLSVAWWIEKDSLAFLHSGAEAICWPLVPGCERLRLLGMTGLQTLLVFYTLSAVVVGLLFWLPPRFTSRAYWGMVALNVVKFSIMALDIRTRFNQHYMAFAISAVFLFLPHKRNALRVMVVMFYFWAGTLKVNWEWISGAGLYRPLWFFHGRWVMVACAYVILLEMGISWGLLARRGWIFWSSLAQAIAFHIMSWPIVGFFYPLLMFATLTIFPLCRLIPRPAPVRGEIAPEGSLLQSVWKGREHRVVYGMMAVFSLFQLIPHAYPGDVAITGEGRLYALHMFDARVVCTGTATLHHPDGSSTVRDLSMGSGDHGGFRRIGCDPIVMYNRARNLCRHRHNGENFVDLDLSLTSRRTTEEQNHRVIETANFCSQDLHYNPFWHNSWILTE